MPKTKISEFSAVPGNNTDIDGINIAEGCAPSGINDAIRELMSQLKDFQAGTAGDSFNGPIGATTPAAGTFTNFSASGTFALTGDQVQISEGGTGQTTANAAFNALAPSQSTHAGKYLKTDGTNTSWDALDISTADITGTLPIANGGTGLTALGTGVQTALGIAVGSSGAFVTNGGALGTPSSGTVTNLTGTASININGTVGATTPTTGAFTTLSASGNITVSGGTANGVAYLNASKVLTTGSALTFDGTSLSVAIVKRDVDNSFVTLLGGTSSATSAAVYATGPSYSAVSTIYIDSAETVFRSLNGVSSRMTLTSTGLGIGTSSPAYKLDVAGIGRLTTAVNSNATSLILNNSNTAAGGVGVSIDGYSGNTSNKLAQIVFGGAGATGGNIDFLTSANGSSYVQQMRLDTSGNLGIGTSSPSGNGRLELNVPSGNNTNITFYENGSSRWLIGSVTGSNAFRFYDLANATERARITSDGNFGIGTTSPQGKVESKTATMFPAVAAYSQKAFVANIPYATSNITSSLLAGYDSNIFGVNVGYSYDGAGYYLAFATNNTTSGTPTERARITSGGNLLVGKTTTGIANTGIELSNLGWGQFTVSGDASLFTNRLDSDGDTVKFYRATSLVGSISVTASATAYNTSSDYRLKDNQQPLTGSGAFIDALKPKTWNWTADGSRGVGFIAHEVQEVSPGSVVGTKDAVDEEGKPIMQAMEYGSAEFIANIIAELQSLRARVAQLEAK